MPDAVHGSHVHAVGDGVGALDGLPRVELRGAELVFLRRVPADRRGIEQHFGALQRREPRAFGIPLVPANQRAHAAKGGIHGLKAQIARREVILLVIKRIVGDVHLAVDAGDLAVGVERDCRVVVEPRRAPLEERSNNGHPGFARQLQPACPWKGPESAPPGRRGADPRAGRNIACGRVRAGRRSARPAAPPRECGRSAAGEVRLRVGAHAHLHEGDREFARNSHSSSLDPPSQPALAHTTRPTPPGGIGLCVWPAHLWPSTLPGSAPRRRWWWSICRACRLRPTG